MLIRHEPNLIARPRHPNHPIGLAGYASSSALEAYFVKLSGDASQAWELRNGITTSALFRCGCRNGSLTVAAKSKLHTSQPSLSRQIRDLEEEIGAQLITRTARGVELTPAGRVFLDHARGVLSQVEAAAEAARRAVRPAKPCFSMGFLTGHELTWMPEALRILRDELPNIDVMISSQYSPLACGRPFERKSRCSFSSKGTRRARSGVPPSCEGAFGCDLTH